MKQFFAWCIAAALAISLRGCGQEAARRPVEEIPATPQIQTGMIAEQILPGADGDIHYSYFLPESYDGRRTYPLVMVMPGYDMMWFGEDSSGSNLDWNGFLSWTQLDTEMIVVSAQLTDWHEKSARQAIELTEYFSITLLWIPAVYTLLGIRQAARRCPRRFLCVPTYMRLICTAHPNGMATTHP